MSEIGLGAIELDKGCFTGTDEQIGRLSVTLGFIVGTSLIPHTQKYVDFKLGPTGSPRQLAQALRNMAEEVERTEADLSHKEPPQTYGTITGYRF